MPFELSTQHMVQTQILNQYLTDSKFSQPVPRYEPEETKFGAEDLEVESRNAQQPNLDEILLVQRQYSGSVYEKNAEELEFDQKRKPSIVISNKKEEEKQGGFSRFISWTAEKMCGKPKPAATEEKSNVGSQPIKAPQPRPPTEEEKKINEMKAAREKELKQQNE